ncbi:hypothetical protein [uncultured Prevotella sp.]|uniref:hypothetical protein n=1 Tax=uncultured Prevotella sp. TaxID=159272 RepID=UPI0027E2BAAC|nr:hypothetical protein [uncultured Prevotella sp.]
MRQRFQNAEIEFVSEYYADNELYKAVGSIGAQLEAELSEFGLCPEECFAETMELLSLISEKGRDVLDSLPSLWLGKYNEFRRFDRRVSPEEHRKAVGIVFCFAALATDSSRHSFYRYQLSEELMSVVAANKFEGWDDTLNRIFSVPLPDGWFDSLLEQQTWQGDVISRMSQHVDNMHRLAPNANLTLQIVKEQHNSGCNQFMGEVKNPKFLTPAEDEAI